MRELEPRIEENGISYERIGDFYFPRLALPEQKERRPIGLYGMLHREYIRKHRPIFYQRLLLSCQFNSYLSKVNEQATERRDVMIEQFKEKEGVTENLKAASPLEWVGRMNSIRNRVEEIILREMIYI